MNVKVFNSWNDYVPVINKVKQKRIEMNIFNREDSKKEYKNLTKELFYKYENNYNSNNEIEPIVLLCSLQKNIETFFPQIDENTISLIEEKLSFEKNVMGITIKNIIQDVFVEKNISEEEIQNKFYLLMHEMIKLSNKFTHFPINENNVDVFIDSTPTYLERELSEQDYLNSPIEEILYSALTPLAKKYGLTLKSEFPVRDIGRTEIRYALDFVFIDKNEKIILNVEADGLNFHQSFQSMALDRQRDRWLLLRDIPVMRFTSKEIFANLHNCLIEIETYIKKKR